MIPIFFIYGLSFFLLGFAIFMQPTKESGFRLGSSVIFLGLFGFFHSINEWMDMFLLLGNSYWGDNIYTVIGVSRFVIGKISYVFLLLFGLNLIKSLYVGVKPFYIAALFIHFTMLIVLFVYGLLRDFDSIWFLRTDYAARYFAALPGALLSGIGIWLYKNTNEIRLFRKDVVPFWFASCAVLFWCYAILAGLIVKEGDFFPANVLNTAAFMNFTGIPVQVFRAACAVGLAFFMVRILELFEYERAKKLENAYDEIVRISTHEQERIGRDIHDGLCQELAGVQLMIKATSDRIVPLLPAEKSSFANMSNVISSAIKSARTMAKNLYPVEIQERGLVHALSDYCARISELYGIECDFVNTGDISEMDHMTSTHIFRIVQEAVGNALKHGKADKIRVVLDTTSGIRAAIEDNGCGFLTTEPASSGMGIRIMKYRASVLKGRLNVGKSNTDCTIVEFIAT